MPVREVIRWGDARLLQPARPVERFDTAELHALVRDLEDTMAALQGAGIAAPQIAVPLQVVIFGGAPSARYPEAPVVPYTVLVNPVLEPLGDEIEEGWEGCLSVPGMRGLVPRHRRLHYRGRDARGAVIERVAEGFHARVVQHECDHLAGILYPMRVRDLRNFGFADVLFPGQTLEDD